MNIVLSCDNKYFLPTRILVDSLLNNNQDVKVWLVHSDITDENIKVIKNDILKNGGQFFEEKVPKSIKNLAESLINNQHFSKDMYYRLFLAWILKDCDRAIYLDSDMLVRKKLIELYEMDLGQYYLAAVLDFDKQVEKESRKRLKLKGHYFNSGMQVIDLKKIREKYTLDEFCKKISSVAAINNLYFPDQDILNVIFDEKIKEVDGRYNYGATIHQNKFRIIERKNVVIVHFITTNKPWLSTYCRYYLFEYWGYLKKYLTNNQKKEYWLKKIKHIF